MIVRRTERSSLPAVVLSLGMIAGAASAITWNGDDAERGITSETGLADRPGPYRNVHVIQNQTSSTRGTATLIDGYWVITARHCVQNGGQYGQVAPPEKIYLDVAGRRYYASAIFVGRWSDEIALVRLAEEVAGTRPIELNSRSDEAGRIVSIGGYGRWGWIGGETRGNPKFHRAFNVPWLDPTGKLRIRADGSERLKTLGLLEGIVQSGDSGGPMFVLNGEDADWEDWSKYRLAGVVAQGGANAWGGESIFARVSSHYAWAQVTMAENPPPSAEPGDAKPNDAAPAAPGR